jgi:hypothetical protein
MWRNRNRIVSENVREVFWAVVKTVLIRSKQKFLAESDHTSCRRHERGRHRREPIRRRKFRTARTDQANCEDKSAGCEVAHQGSCSITTIQ